MAEIKRKSLPAPEYLRMNLPGSTEIGNRNRYHESQCAVPLSLSAVACPSVSIHYPVSTGYPEESPVNRSLFNMATKDSSSRV